METGGSGCGTVTHYRPNLASDRARPFLASSSRFFFGASVAIDPSSRAEMPATSSTAPRNAASFVFEGFVTPLIFRTYCSAAARTSSSVTGGSKLNKGLIFRHISKLYLTSAALSTNFLVCEAAAPPLPRASSKS